MSFWVELCVLASIISLILTALIIPEIIHIAFARSLFDTPDSRKIHQQAIPRLGGTSFVPSIVLSGAFSIGCGLLIDAPEVVQHLHAATVPVLFLMCALLLIYLVGMADDLIGVRYRSKFVIQIVSACLLIASGVCYVDGYGLLGIGEAPVWVSWPVTAFMVVYIINAVNLIDGINGLASGICIISLCCYGAIFLASGAGIYALTAFATAATLLAFFWYNVFGSASRHTKIFMGDTGSLTAGLIVAFLSIELTRVGLPADIERFNPMLLAFSPVLIPLFDVVRVAFHRIRRGRNPFLPDRGHIHHKLLDLGFTSRQVLLLLLGADILFIAGNLLLALHLDINLIILADILLWTLGNCWVTARIRRREKLTGQRLYD